jgi:hypothetical protein
MAPNFEISEIKLVRKAKWQSTTSKSRANSYGRFSSDHIWPVLTWPLRKELRNTTVWERWEQDETHKYAL